MNVPYPVMLHLDGKKVIVIGGGRVAERKVHSLLETGADLVVVSPEAREKIEKWAREGKIRWHQRSFEKEDLKGAFMVFAATDDSATNQLVKREAGSHQLLLLADDPDGSDFHLPSHFHRGRLTMAVSTGGASPILARKIREQLEQEYDDKYESYVDFLFTARQRILEEVKEPHRKRELLEKLTDPAFFQSANREEKFIELLQER